MKTNDRIFRKFMENHDERKDMFLRKMKTEENNEGKTWKDVEIRRKENDNERWKRKKERTGHIHEDKDQELKTQTTN